MNEFKEIVICPITQDTFVNPVMTTAGHTYSQSAIENWLKDPSHNCDPYTGALLNDKQLIPNHFVAGLLGKQKFTDNDFQCFLTHELIENPVTTSAGYTYERAALEDYIRQHGDIDPVTKTPFTLSNQKFIINYCAKSCIKAYKEEREKTVAQKIKLLQALENNDFETVRQIQIKDFSSLLGDEPLALREKFLASAVEHLQADLAEKFYTQLIYRVDQHSRLFFATVKRIQKIAKANFYTYANPLSKFGFTPFSLNEALTILKENLEIQRQFRSNLLNNLDTAGNYSQEDILFSIDSKDENGDTLLHQAVKNNNLPLINWLVSNSADCERRNQQGETPLELAIKMSNTAVTECLIQSGVLFDLNKMKELPDNDAKMWLNKVELTTKRKIELSWSGKVMKFFDEKIPGFYRALSNIQIFRIEEVEQLKLKQLIEEKQAEFIKSKEQKNTRLRNALFQICTPLCIHPSPLSTNNGSSVQNSEPDQQPLELVPPQNVM